MFKFFNKKNNLLLLVILLIIIAYNLLNLFMNNIENLENNDECKTHKFLQSGSDNSSTKAVNKIQLTSIKSKKTNCTFPYSQDVINEKLKNQENLSKK